MDLLILQVMAAYRANPVFTVSFLLFSAFVGAVLGYVFLGPLIFR